MKKISYAVFFLVCSIIPAKVSYAESDPYEGGFWNEIVIEVREALAGRADTNANLIESKDCEKKFRLKVDYDLPIESLVEKGNYGVIDERLNSRNFKSMKTGKAALVVRLVRFDKSVLIYQALRKLTLLGYRPLDIKEFLAFGAAYPEEQKRYTILGLGSQWRIWDGNELMPLLDSDGSQRKLGLFFTFHSWVNASYRLAVVRE